MRAILSRNGNLFILFVDQVLEKYGTSDIGVKRLGQLNTEGWWEACGHKFPSKMRFCKWQSRVETLMADNTFNPIRVESDGKGGHKVRFYPH